MVSAALCAAEFRAAAREVHINLAREHPEQGVCSWLAYRACSSIHLTAVRVQEPRRARVKPLIPGKERRLAAKARRTPPAEYFATGTSTGAVSLWKL